MTRIFSSRAHREAAITVTPEPIAPAALLSELMYEWRHSFSRREQLRLRRLTTTRRSFTPTSPFSSACSEPHPECCHSLITVVELSISARRAGEFVLFTFADNGPGIPPEYHEVIFRKFGQVSSANAPRVRSSGLGLTFCKLVVDLHGGMIWVRSREGEGSSFHVQLPVEARYDEGRCPARAARSGVMRSISDFVCRANQYARSMRSMSRAGARIGESRRCLCRRVQQLALSPARRADLRSGIRGAARQNPHIRTIVMGCAAGVPDRDESTAALATLPNVDAIVPGADMASIAAAAGIVSSATTPGAQTGARGLLRIQDGCDEHCSSARRRALRRKTTRDSTRWCRRRRRSHNAPGDRVTGIHIGTYGRDTGSSLWGVDERADHVSPRSPVRLSSSRRQSRRELAGCSTILRASLRIFTHRCNPIARVLREWGGIVHAGIVCDCIEKLTSGRQEFGLRQT